MKILALDPGKRRCGWACLINGKLTSCGCLRSENSSIEHSALEMVGSRIWTPFDLIVYEKPQIYATGKARPSDLVDLAIVGAIIATQVSSKRILAIHPKDWKGQRPKSVTEAIVRDRLPSIQGWLDITKKKFHNDVYDAAGIALWAYEKFDQSKTSHT